LSRKLPAKAVKVAPSNARIDAILKGALISETYTLFATWDYELTTAGNFERFYSTNAVGTKTTAWLRHVGRVLRQRFVPEGRDRALVELAQKGCELEVWKPLLLWHISRDEGLLRSFLVEWLFAAHEKRTEPLRAAMLHQFLLDYGKRLRMPRPWAESTIARVGAGLLRMAADFGLLRGVREKEFASYQLPERSFLYLLHAMRDERQSPAKVLDAPDWRMFLMHVGDIERELLRLHQFRLLEYHVAGSIVQLSLPCATSREYAERMVA
jgi:hypothetical protein